MTPEALKELFRPFGAVSVKRMFGGAGVSAEGLCFAIEQGGEVFVKTDELSQQSFAEAGSSPFIYVARGKPMTMSFWRLPPIAYDEADELRRFASLGLEAARRAAAVKAKPKVRKPAKGKARA
jgi:DNA transformation protein and related proteins